MDQWRRCSDCRFFMTRVFRDLKQYQALRATWSKVYYTYHEKVTRALKEGQEVRIFWCRLHQRGPTLKEDTKRRCWDFQPL